MRATEQKERKESNKKIREKKIAIAQFLALSPPSVSLLPRL
jgi:hypothetical protein